VSLLKRIEKGQEPGVDQQLSKLQELRVKRSTPRSGTRDTYSDLKNRIQQRLIAELDPGMDLTQTAEVRATIQEMFETMLHEEQIVLTRNEKKKLFEQIVAEILGYGPLEQYLNLEGISEHHI
jgi:pilus assembly protein CpaF